MIPAVVLAGGASRRMGGGVKPLLAISSTRLIDLVIARISKQTDIVGINANEGDFGDLGLPVFGDSFSNRPGPLAGILASMDWAAEEGHDWVVTVAGDTPFFPDDLVSVLKDQIGTAPIALAATEEDGRLFSHPVFGLWSTALANDLRAAIQQGTRKVLDFTDPKGAVLVPFDSADDPFFNINRPADLETAAARLESV